MFGGKKEVKRKARPAGRGGSLAQYGLFDMPNDLGNVGGMEGFDDNDDNDEDFEAELAALTSGTGAEPKKRKAPPKVLPSARLDAMVAESMRDIGDDEELSGDEDDPDLLEELNELTGGDSETAAVPDEDETAAAVPDDGSAEESGATIKLLEERIATYTLAVKKANAENEGGRARRYARGLKTLEEMLADAKHGRPINTADVPPLLPPSATGVTSPDDKPNVPVPTSEGPSELKTPESAPVSSEAMEENLRMLKERQREYKLAALAWKKAGNNDEAILLVRISKQFDAVFEALSAGKPVDLSDMPPSPSLPTTIPSANDAPPVASVKEDSETQHETPPPPSQAAVGDADGDVLGSALKERLEVYKRSKVTAEADGKGAKVRMYGRLCKQFEEAIKKHERGKPIDLEDLPTPPGFPPLATLLGPPPAVASVPKPPAEPLIDESEAKTDPVSEPIPSADPSEQSEPAASPNRKAPEPPPRSKQGIKPQRQGRTRADKQLAELQQRQHELKQAALAAKQDGDLELARTYLRQAKGMDPLIQASVGGLPVDMNSVPLSPLAKLRLDELSDSDTFVVVSQDPASVEGGGDDQQIYENMENQLVKQIKTCLSTRDHSKALGDVPGYNRWERLALGYTRDLDMLRVKRRDALPPPVHHYETKTYAIVQSCTDLGDADLEISIVRGVNYPREADTYVMFEFPWPTDSPLSNRTSTIRESNNPEYEAVFPLTGAIDRSSRQCQRVFKRHGLKCQVWSKGGFFRSDSLLGTVTVKLQPLETQCILHDSFPLMDGRKATGGKLEVKIRLRNPILTKQIEQVTDKWLVIDR
ncbi:coiled-coil and C2 domain-containing protein 1-like isoform X2 [Athalia rosae]|uniref:coiled-coil and C2 domain-containing protein 1-like isoform X2 n=1 Tax=Athalia rosae TaxID=37344 RepID=UPI0020335066|nr:coiled-coil and C2 domain-containing protein 1-like isoform X2 [Athalia rosae]